ncbi:hypothetical protein, partial [Acinetobacter baumannii]|uniref:hypothetical protein n=1 Tax=Acinetobacter baumannii TaxID=470 RepID=UPI00339413EE
LSDLVVDDVRGIMSLPYCPIGWSLTLHNMIIALGPAVSSEPNQDRTTPDPHKRSAETTLVGKLNALHRPVTLQ